jgi:hypothetical protein
MAAAGTAASPDGVCRPDRCRLMRQPFGLAMEPKLEQCIRLSVECRRGVLR